LKWISSGANIRVLPSAARNVPPAHSAWPSRPRI
jgi:hypothetical protein